MKNLLFLNLRFVKFFCLILLVVGFSGAAFGATFTVTKTADTNDGVCDADCSLREAIAAANSSSTNDVIIFSSLFNSLQTITLSGSQLIITNSGTLDITGPDATLLTISGNRSSRVFFVNSGAITTFNNLRIIQGNGENGDFGGGIVVVGQLTVNNSTIEDNGPYSSGLTNFGGGVYVDSSGLFNLNNSIVQNNSVRIGGAGISSFGNVSITNSIIRNNTASSHGGGIRATGTMSISNSLISNNRVELIAGGGGGIYIIGKSSTMTISNSTVSGNTSNDSGGGIATRLGATLAINNSTISGNTSLPRSSGVGGGGIYNNDGLVVLNNSTVNGNATVGTSLDGGGGAIYNNSFSTIRLTNVTISNNRTTASRGGGINNLGTAELTNVTVTDNESNYNVNNQAGGGGIFNRFNSSAVTVKNSIIANNRDSSGIAPDFGGTMISQGYNLIENTAGTILTGTMTGNLTGRNPQLLPLGDYGGAIQTVALLPISPAIDAGDPSNFPETDQRGIIRPQDGDLNGSMLPDIGAYERQVAAFTTTNLNDTNDGVCDANCSLREAIAAANAAATPDSAVVFTPGLFNTPRTITLTGGELAINNSNATFLINGPGANLLSISGNNQSRVLYLAASSNATVNGVTITGGNGAGAITSGAGGGIFNNGGRLIVDNSVVSGNRSPNGNGGGIRNDNGGSLLFNRSTLRNNVANGDGGGIFCFGTGSIVNVAESTINNNTASSGSGIYNFSLLNLTNSTVSGNSATLFGGGVFTDGLNGGISNLTGSTISNNTAGTSGGGGYSTTTGVVNARNNIIADNSAGNSSSDFTGSLVAPAYNLIENTNGTIITGTAPGNLLGQDPQLLPLGNYGGTTQTQALRANSPAIDKGGNILSNTDQRGQSRPYDFPNIVNASGGNGSDIGAYERQPTDISGLSFFDFDGDGKSDISVFRPENGTWYLQNSTSGFSGAQFGVSTDKIVPADYDGDGKTDLAVYRSGVWYLQRSQAGFTGIAFGAADDIPVPADYDGDGKTDLAVFRPSNGTWYLQRSQLGFTGVQFGQNGDKPVAADYDGDGKSDVAVYRNGTWFVQRSQLGFTGVAFGDGADKPTPADFDGDGRADIAVFRPSNGTWYLNRSQLGITGVQFGASGDLPVPADYDGDGRADVAVFRNGTWFLNRSTQGFTGIAFGAATDKPVPNAFVP